MSRHFLQLTDFTKQEFEYIRGLVRHINQPPNSGLNTLLALALGGFFAASGADAIFDVTSADLTG